MTSRILCLGHSHAAALAATNAPDLEVLNFWHLPGAVRDSDGRITLALALRAPLVSLIDGAVHLDIGLMRHPRPYDFELPEAPHLPLDPDAELITYAAMREAMAARLAPYFAIIDAAHDAIGRGRMVHLEAPPVHEAEADPPDDLTFREYFGADAVFAPAPFRQKLWRLQAALVRAHCEARGILYIPHPPEAADAALYLRPAYAGKPGHANAGYGELILKQIRALVADGTLAATSAAPAAPPPASQGAGVWPPLPWTLQPPLTGHIDQFGPVVIDGWAQHTGDRSEKPRLTLEEGGQVLATFEAGTWRRDLEEFRDGDGRWGLHAALPPTIRDGMRHTLQLRYANAPALPHPIIFQGSPDAREIPAAPPRSGDLRATRRRPPRAAPDSLVYSVIVVFHNMRREAARTLASLSRTYQRDIGAMRYEVIAIDNGGREPLDGAWVGSFGPEFRLIRPDNPHASPVFAINEAAAQARGDLLAIMIDGAHILSPGILREAWDAATAAPGAVIGMRQWFVGGDQRWLSELDYRREDEDLLFDRINWPHDGYALFDIASPLWEGPNYWLDGLLESNCLILPRTLWQQIGGMDQAFNEPGAGYANLDVFRRAVEASPEPAIVLMGEGTFHQFHEGTTTNVSFEDKEARVRFYHSRYAALRGELLSPLQSVDVRHWGQLQTRRSIWGRQRPTSPAGMGITGKVRKGSLPHLFDEAAQEYLQSVYVETALDRETEWMGEKLGVAPADVLRFQALLWQLRPDCVALIGVNPGLTRYIRDVVQLAPMPGTRVETVDHADQARTAGAESVLVLFRPHDSDHKPIEALRAAARLVTLRSYLIVLNTSNGQPWLGYSNRWIMKAIRVLLESEPFVIDPTCTTQLITTSPNGYLQRIEADTEVLV